MLDCSVPSTGLIHSISKGNISIKFLCGEIDTLRCQSLLSVGYPSNLQHSVVVESLFLRLLGRSRGVAPRLLVASNHYT